MRADTREELVGLIRSNPTVEVVLPDEYYLEGRDEIRTQIDGIKVMLHRWLYEQLYGVNLGADRLRRNPETNPRNVNPYLMERVSVGTRGENSLKACRKGHLYSETGEFPPGRTDRRRCVQCWRDAQDKINERQRVGGVSQADLNRAKTHCLYGHEYTPENSLQWAADKGRRRCRVCETSRAKARWNERKNDGNSQESRARRGR